MRTSWAMYDTRTGRRVGMSSVPTEAAACRALDWVRRRDRVGGRPDIHDLVPYLDVVELTADTWGSVPGDVIAEPRS